MTHKCFHCDQPANAQVSRLRAKGRTNLYARYICLELRCWNAWWKLSEEVAIKAA